MPTIHLSVPEALYRNLKAMAAEYGVQITDVVKFLVKEGLERRLRQRRIAESERLELLEVEVMYLKDMLEELFRRVDDLKEALEEVKTPVIEPEIVESR